MEHRLTEAERIFLQDMEQHLQAFEHMGSAERMVLPEEHINLLVFTVVAEAVQVLGREKGTLQVMEVVRSIREEAKKRPGSTLEGVGEPGIACV